MKIILGVLGVRSFTHGFLCRVRSCVQKDNACNLQHLRHTQNWGCSEECCVSIFRVRWARSLPYCLSLFNPEDGCSTFHRNIEYRVLYPRWQYSSWSLLPDPQVWCSAVHFNLTLILSYKTYLQMSLLFCMSRENHCLTEWNVSCRMFSVLLPYRHDYILATVRPSTGKLNDCGVQEISTSTHVSEQDKMDGDWKVNTCNVSSYHLKYIP